MRARLLPALAGTLAVMLLGTLAVAQNQPAAPSPPTGQTAVPLTSEQLVVSQFDCNRLISLRARACALIAAEAEA